MHALYKKHYYDVLKSGQEDTILESDTSIEDCEREDMPTAEVGCYARTHLKSTSVQTHCSRNNKNFRNEYTVTSDEGSGAVALESPINREGCPIHHCRSYEDVATIRSRSSQGTVTSNWQNPLQKIKKTAVLIERAVECVEFFSLLSLQKKGLTKLSKGTITAKGDDESTQCDCVEPKVNISNCDEYQYIPSNRGLAACRTFSLGSPESRRLQNEHCKTKLIGGCRVPVSKNYKSRF